jgi:hypothetical protein
MSNKKSIFSDDELTGFSAALEERFKKVGLSDVLSQKCETTNNHLDEGFFKKLTEGHHLVKDNALKGI